MEAWTKSEETLKERERGERERGPRRGGVKRLTCSCGVGGEGRRRRDGAGLRAGGRVRWVPVGRGPCGQQHMRVRQRAARGRGAESVRPRPRRGARLACLGWRSGAGCNPCRVRLKP